MYDLDKPAPPEDEFDFYVNFMKKDAKILEAMCGTGRFLIPFLEKGFDVHGFDGSADMLDACLQKANQKQLPANVTNAKASTFQTEDKYDLIITPGGSFTCITDKEELQASLKNMYRLLKDDGKLIIEMLTPVLSAENDDSWTETNRKTRNDGNEIVQYSKSSFNADQQIISYPLKYELVDGQTVLQSEEMVLHLKLYRREDFKAILEECGFQIVNEFDGNTTNRATDESELVVYECLKQ